MISSSNFISYHKALITIKTDYKQEQLPTAIKMQESINLSCIWLS